jgi:hypothetical protein
MLQDLPTQTCASGNLVSFHAFGEDNNEMNTLSDFEKPSFCRDEVRHEFSLPGMRSTLLVSRQSFPVVPFTILNTAANSRAVLAAEYLVAGPGMLLAMPLVKPINAAHRALLGL